MSGISRPLGAMSARLLLLCVCALAGGCDSASGSAADPADFDEVTEEFDPPLGDGGQDAADSQPDTQYDEMSGGDTQLTWADADTTGAGNDTQDLDISSIDSDTAANCDSDDPLVNDSILTDLSLPDVNPAEIAAADAGASDTVLTPDDAIFPASDVSTALTEWSPPTGMSTSAKIACNVMAIGKPANVPGKFVEVAVAAGIDIDTPPLWPPNTPFAGAIVRDGTGVAVADFNNDGILDMYIPEATGKDRLYLATAPLTYVGYDAQIDGLRETGALAADFDGDGDADLVVSGYATRVLRNDGPSAKFGIKFVDVSAAVGVTSVATQPFQGASAADVDRDGWIDLLLVANKEEGGDGKQVFPPPLYKHKLYRNKGNWQFIDESAALPLTKAHPCYIGSWFDADGDGDLDVYFVNDFGSLFGPNQFLRNDTAAAGAAFKFVDVSFQAGLDIAANGMGLAVGDVDRDGDFDLYITGRKNGNYLMINDGKAGFWDNAVLDNIWLPGPNYVSWGALFVDFDSDGFQDGFIANGYLEPGFADSLGGPGGIADTQSKIQKDNYFHATGGGSFVDVAAKAGLDWGGQSRAPAWADLDADGFADLIVGQVSGKPRLYHNGCDNRGWLHVRLKGKDGNINGIGAVIAARIGEIKQMRQIEAGSTGLWSTSEPAALFGLAKAQKVDELTVKWPDGVVQKFYDIPAHRRVTVLHP